MSVTTDYRILPPPKEEASAERMHVCTLCEREFRQSRALLQQWERALGDHVTRLIWWPQYCPRCERQRLAR